MNHQALFDQLIGILGKKHVVMAREKLYHFTIDHSSGERIYPLCVVTPGSTEEVSQVMKLCYDMGQKVTVRAGGSSVSGGFMSDTNDIVLSIERMNNILSINNIDRYVVAESGVNTQQLQEALSANGLWFPQNISSAAMCCIGGNVAISSGSPKSLKYGSTKNYVLNLEVVLPNGQVLWTGKNVKKNATGYNLTQLFVGSEGTLGIITKVVLEVIPPKNELLMMVPFQDEEKLFQFVNDFFIAGFSASSLEFLDARGYNLVLDYLHKGKTTNDQNSGVLWIELESENDEENLGKAEAICGLIAKHTSVNVSIAQTKSDITALWAYRKKIGEAALNHGSFKDLDLVVPRSKNIPMYKAIKECCEAASLSFITVGHVGNGNFHINIFRDQHLSLGEWEEKIQSCSEVLFEKAVELGGDISGEHGIGKYNKYAFNNITDPVKIGVMRGVKTLFDPNEILNSGTLFLDEASTKNTQKLSSQATLLKEPKQLEI